MPKSERAYRDAKLQGLCDDGAAEVARGTEQPNAEETDHTSGHRAAGGLDLPGVEEGSSYGTPGFRVRESWGPNAPKWLLAEYDQKQAEEE